MRFALLPLLLAAPAGCVAIARPPAAPADPVPVFLLQQGAHTGVILPAADGAEGAWVEYAFGNWRWYGEQRDGTLNGLYALAVPNDAALGRRYADAAPPADPLLEARGARVQPFHAERARVHELRRALDAEFEASPVAPRLLERNGLWIAKAQTPYALDSNCSDATVSWLRALGCSVTAPGITRSVVLLTPRE